MKHLMIIAAIVLFGLPGCGKSEHSPPVKMTPSQYLKWRGIPPRPAESRSEIRQVQLTSTPAVLLLHTPGWQMNTGFDVTAIENPADYKEVDWSRWIATQAGHDPIFACEARTRSGKRVDILTDHEAIEVEWVSKWYQAIGQAGFYAIETGRQPAIILLSRGDEEREILLCQAVCARYGIRLYIQRVPAPPGKSELLPPPESDTMPETIGYGEVIFAKRLRIKR